MPQRSTDCLIRESIAVKGTQTVKQRDLRAACRPRPRRLTQVVFRTELEFLENRITPSANLAITSASVVDWNDQPLSVINVGAFVSIQADFTAEDLPADASYVVGYTVNGLTQDSGNVTSAPASRGRTRTGSTGAVRGNAGDQPGHSHRRSRPLRRGDNVH